MAHNETVFGHTVQKFDIKLKSKPANGLVLQLHHTIRNPNGESHRIRFSAASFDDVNDRVACSDNVGNLFILDFSVLKFWKLANIGPCSAMYFAPDDLDTLIIATVEDFFISFVDIENGQPAVRLKGHTAPIKHISFSRPKCRTLLTSSPIEAILWELNSFTKYFTLYTYENIQIQDIMFTPSSDYLVAAFQNDTIQIWKQDSMKSIKQIHPKDLKHLKSLTFTTNGRAMAIAGLTPTLILFSMDTWKIIKLIDLSKYKIVGVRQISFIPQVFDGGSNNILAVLSSMCTLHLIELKSSTLIHNISPDSSPIRKFVVSPTGKYFLSILQLGEINIYNSTSVLDMAMNASGDNEQKVVSAPFKNCILQVYKKDKGEIGQKMKTHLHNARLRRILMHYGEYPEKFRTIIWRSLLNTPKNITAYESLLEKGIHESYKIIEKEFTIHSSMSLKNLKRLLSCLAHWCPLFSMMKFLPGFVFPFVRVLQKDPLVLFECIATVLINYCQLWFEYAPFPPISVLAIIENVLSEHDPKLLHHFCEIGVTSQIYALIVLETAFSEVLSSSEWLILWDHILSNEPSFLLMAIVSYNIVQRNALTKLKELEKFEAFFLMQNPINLKMLLKKSYMLLDITSEDIHPRRFFSSFTALEKGTCYQQFTGYPKATICLKLAKKEKDALKKNKLKTNTVNEFKTKSQEIIHDRWETMQDMFDNISTE